VSPEPRLVLQALREACGRRIFSGGSVAPSTRGPTGVPAAVPEICAFASRGLRTLPSAICISAVTSWFRNRRDCLPRSRSARCRARWRARRIVFGVSRRAGARHRLRGGAFETIGFVNAPHLIA
jgi:hypothetical protein